jgi:hypothetical protein
MTGDTIQRLGQREAALYETARQIREMLDRVRDQWPGDEDVAEERVLELVTEEDDAV